MRGRLAPAIVAAAVVLAGCGGEATAVRGVTVTVNPPTTSTVAPTAGIGSTTTTTAVATTTTAIATTTTTPPGPVVDGPAAPDFAVELDNGGAFVLAQQTDPTLLFFWATWCHSCHEMMPVVDRIAADYQGALTVIALARESERVDVDRDAQEGFTSGSTRWACDDDLGISRDYAIPGNPVTVLVYDGVEVDRWLGPATEEALRSAIDGLLTLIPPA